MLFKKLVLQINSPYLATTGFQSLNPLHVGREGWEAGRLSLFDKLIKIMPRYSYLVTAGRGRTFPNKRFCCIPRGGSQKRFPFLSQSWILPSRASGKGPECLEKTTNRRAAVYLPRSKGNGSKRGMQESSCGSRTSLAPRPVLTPRQAKAAPAHGRPRFGPIRCGVDLRGDGRAATPRRHRARVPRLPRTPVQSHTRTFHSHKIHVFHTYACPLVDARIEKASTYNGNEDVQLINFLGVTDEQEKAH